MVKRVPGYWPWLLVMVLCTTGFALSCKLSCLAGTGVAGDDSASMIDMFFGGARHAFGASFYQKADQYFHRGVPHVEVRAFDDSPLQRLGRQITPDGHLHRVGEEIAEMMPWLWMALRMDPHNVEVFRVAAFWLATSAARPDLARDLLTKAHQRNPRNYQIRLDLGRMELKQGRREVAREHFRSAMRLWPLTEGVEPEQAQFEKAEVLVFMALLAEADGDPRAIKMYEDVLSMFPDRDTAGQRLADLRAGRTPAVAADTLLRRLVVAHDERMQEHRCEREGYDPARD